MRNIKIKNIIALFIVAFFTITCTKDFEEMNADPYVIDTYLVNPASFLPHFFQYGFNNDHYTHQRAEQLYSNQYCQYFANTNITFFTDQYRFESEWAEEGMWGRFYANVLKVVKITGEEFMVIKPEISNNVYQIMRIGRTVVAARVTDYWGDIPYFEGGSGEPTIPYDSQKEIYYSFFDDLKDAPKKFIDTNSNTEFSRFDYLYDGDLAKWEKFANSLRLRFAIRISDVDPEKAKVEGEAALADGVMDNYDQSARLYTDPDPISYDQRGYPMYAISDWQEFVMSKTMEEVLENLSNVVDPREAVWFAPAPNYPNNDTTNPAGNEYKGIINGLNSSQLALPGNAWADNSNVLRGLDNVPHFYQRRRLTIMPYAEVLFLKAEAGLLGWAGAGDIQQNYENGIREAMKEATYGSDTILDAAAVEVYMAGGDVPFKTNGTNEEKLEQIITQKWLALFPGGYEPWAEFRRTGYPKMYLVANNDPSSSVPDNTFIKKLRYVEDEYLNNNELVTDPTLNQNQGDGQNVRVWWDVEDEAPNNIRQ